MVVGAEPDGPPPRRQRVGRAAHDRAVVHRGDVQDMRATGKRIRLETEPVPGCRVRMEKLVDPEIDDPVAIGVTVGMDRIDEIAIWIEHAP